MIARTDRTDAVRPVIRGGARVSDQVYAALEVAIRDLTVLPGQPLREHDLAEQLDVSRTPLREAIARLVDAGLLTVVSQVGTRVARISMRAVRDAQFARQALEVSAFELVARDPDRDVLTLRSLLDRQTAARRADDFDAFFHADDALHAEIFRMAGYPGVWDDVVRRKVHLDRLRRLSAPDADTIDELIGEHGAIVDAAEAGEVVAGADHIRIHASRILDLQPRLQAAHPGYFTD